MIYAQELLENEEEAEEEAATARRNRELTDKYLAGELNFSSFVKEMKYDVGHRDKESDDDDEDSGKVSNFAYWITSSSYDLKGLAKKRSSSLVNFTPALVFHFFRNFPETFSKPGYLFTKTSHTLILKV